MAAPIRPAGAKVFGREKWLFVPAIASVDAPTKVELTAEGVFDLSCYFYTDTGRPDVNQNRVTPPTRICDTQQYEAMGLGNWTGGDAIYAVDPQGAALSDGKKALEALPEGTRGFLVKRLAVAVATDIDTGQFVTTYPVEFGVPIDTTTGEGEAAEAAIKQAYAITGKPGILKAIVAGT